MQIVVYVYSSQRVQQKSFTRWPKDPEINLRKQTNHKEKTQMVAITKVNEKFEKGEVGNC